MAADYQALKRTVIDVADDFSSLDIVAGYGSKYAASTKLGKIGISDPVLAVMPPRFNKVMRNLVGGSWRRVGSIDLVACETIGDLILLACRQSGATVPPNEPL
ncbi:hypothetical protein EJP67_10695 [Variovorax guangxiensis]|uniref:Uncharacterized protein n=1 Tax=Variovorax guangxiensis TaxID=1775474 RepID=A0A433MID4_9BURK|nr:hypothetical protein [Variovorax guangxiensis]RUR67522.1 hypothetical protein EJP67_10695 [Variovorax guangxiensis]